MNPRKGLILDCLLTVNESRVLPLVLGVYVCPVLQQELDQVHTVVAPRKVQRGGVTAI